MKVRLELMIVSIGDSETGGDENFNREKLKQKRLSPKISSKVKSFLSSNATILLLKKTLNWKFLALSKAPR